MSAAVFRSSQGLTALVAAIELTTQLDEDEVSPDALASVLSAPKLVLVAKKFDLQSAYDEVLQASRVLTDLRPLFDDSSEALPLGSIVVHTLQLTTHSGTAGVQDTFVAADDEDLQDLREQIDRAITKARQLRTALIGTELSVVGEKESRND